MASPQVLVGASVTSRSNPLTSQQQQQRPPRPMADLEASCVTLPAGYKLHQCPVCPYSTPNGNHMQYHMRSHTGEKPYSCCYCPYRAAQKTHLKTHMRTHTGEKPYACDKCDFRAAQTGNLRKHLAKHHTQNSPNI